MRTLVTNAYVLDMVGEVPNIEKKDILIENNIIKKIEKDTDRDYIMTPEQALEYGMIDKIVTQMDKKPKEDF